jgi:hypothetical protein
MAQIIPNTNLFIVTSAINATIGAVSRDERINQTLDGLKILRKQQPNAVIILSDGSPVPVEEEIIKELSPYINLAMNWSTDKDVADFAKAGRKSEAECVLLIKTLMMLQQEPRLMQMMQGIKRIYKISARTFLLEEFDEQEHDHFGKYVFKKRMPTWIADERKDKFTDLLITRMYSFCPSLISDYIQTLYKNIGGILKYHVDTEHAHYFYINKEYLIELDQIHCIGVVAGTGGSETY